MTKERRLGRGLAALLGGPLEETPSHEAPAAHETQPQQEHGEHHPTHAPPEQHPAEEPHDDNDDPPVIKPRLLRLEEESTEAEGDEPQSQSPEMHGPGDTQTLLLAIDEIDTNPYQPRREFSESEIASLAESLKSHDLLQPVLVRKVGERYELISGERRLRAATRAGWTHLRASVREADDRLVAELAIVENLQRKDLNPIEKALAFQRYLQEHGSTQEELGKRLKIDRSTIANLMRLLELPSEVREALRNEYITAGHARALLPLGDEKQQIAFCHRIRSEGISVRDVERMVQETIAAEDREPLAIAAPPSKTKKQERSEHLAQLEQQFRRALGARVDIRASGKGRGKIAIHFANHEEFERLREYLLGAPVSERQAG